MSDPASKQVLHGDGCPGGDCTCGTPRPEPELSITQKAAKWVYDALYNTWPGGATRRVERVWKPLNYFFYATMRWGLAEGIRRYWEFELHPKNTIEWAQRRWRKHKLVDRRPKKSYNRTVYAVDRDGDLFLVECPQCHDTQGLFFNWHSEQQAPVFDFMPPRVFECNRCQIYFTVHLEDGLRKIRDHRDGVPPLPTIAVYDDNHLLHLGISKDAPWWWRRVEVMRDLHDGKDAHGHKPYVVTPKPPQGRELGNCLGPETEQPKS